MKKRFNTIEINDTHVGIFGLYFTSSGEKCFGTVWLENSTCLWVCELAHIKTHVTHALQEIY